MIDLPDFVDKKRQMNAQDKLEQLQMYLATNNRGMEDKEYKTLIEFLNKEAGFNFNDNKEFDRDKFEELRFLTNMGANRQT
ncbi:MAG: hypothetical protein ACQET8_22700 [Bacillota bacterium]